MNAGAALALAVARFLPRYLFIMVCTLATFPLAPLLALFVVYREESETTGYPSQFPGMPRAFLVRPLRLFQTHDDCLDAYWYSGKYRALPWLARYTQADYDRMAWLRYVCRVAWLWRNPAYGFAQAVGFDQDGMTYLYARDEESLWDTGAPNLSLWIVRNARGQSAFLFQWQWYFYRDRCLEVALGWKIPWEGDPRNRAMLAARISPFKRYG